MSYIVDEILYDKISDIAIQVLEKERGEPFEPNEICSLEVDISGNQTPDDLIMLGVWLINTATEIKKKYTSIGKVRKSHKKP
ncbi:hypothetical protein [Spirosoma foliorum]|uniref:Uncharacterized protein n=1 Tax=Spirosoma foliorum TaxID=2710596 RepID=A0A7G5H2N0_9BACT|nr:hypothetical protein [Spirosoma foliorum]QMW05372.1 hypothetical protein H3H32_11005 [Spirosoma foliorum]